MPTLRLLTAVHPDRDEYHPDTAASVAVTKTAATQIGWTVDWIVVDQVLIRQRARIDARPFGRLRGGNQNHASNIQATTDEFLRRRSPSTYP